MDNGNDPPARIPFLEISDENMIPTNSGLKSNSSHHEFAVYFISLRISEQIKTPQTYK